MRKCEQCKNHIPPRTKHYKYDGHNYCVKCLTAEPIEALAYFIGDNFIGTTDDGEVNSVLDFEDGYEGDAG